MTSRSNSILIIVLSLLLVGFLASGLWLVQRGLQPEEARTNPTVVETAPSSGGQASRATTIEFLFDQQMDRTSVEEALSIAPAFAYGVEWDNEGRADHLIIQPRHALEWDTTYQVTIGTEARNAAGRPLEAPAQVEFSTSNVVAVSEVLPAAGSESVGLNQPITVRFDRPVVEVTSLEAQEELPQPVLVNPAVEGIGRWLASDLYGFYPTGDLSAGTRYEVMVTPLVAPGLELPETYEWSFVTEGPSLQASFPYDGASQVASATAIKLLFAQPMDRESVERNFRLSAHGEEGSVAGEFRWEDDDTLLFVPRDPLDVASEYEIEVDEGATAQGGARGLLSPYRAVFTTVDYLAVESVQPAPGSIEVSTVPTDTAITVQFNHPVVPVVGLAKKESLPNPLQFSPALEGEGEWITTSLFQFRPAEPLEPSTEYVATVDSDLQDTLGSYQNAPYSWSFLTEFPRVIRVEPSNPRRHVPPEGPIALRFNQPMNPKSAEEAFTLSGVEGEVAGDFEWADDDSVLQFFPDTPLTREAEYTIELDPGAGGAKGGETRESFEASIVAAPELRVASVSPAPGATDVNVWDSLQITFNTLLDPEIFAPNQPSLDLKPYISIEPRPKGQLSNCCYDPETLMLSAWFVDRGLEPSTEYTVTVKGIQDESGQLLSEPYSWSFRTGELPPVLYLA
ncbi:MAG: Ig-like domain-containing protein, partial [Chloroflexota bacterium]|nr:Ig-like domain-containing protein [Chloroflexota bacterium]